jgi:hypothetical protein
MPQTYGIVYVGRYICCSPLYLSEILMRRYAFNWTIRRCGNMMDDLSGIETVIFIRRAYERLQILRAVLIKSGFFWDVSLINCYYRRRLLCPSRGTAWHKKSDHFLVFSNCNILDNYHALYQWLNSTNNWEIRGYIKNVVCSITENCCKFYGHVDKFCFLESVHR